MRRKSTKAAMAVACSPADDACAAILWASAVRISLTARFGVWCSVLCFAIYLNSVLVQRTPGTSPLCTKSALQTDLGKESAGSGKRSRAFCR